jgi:hypothetical protein
MQRRGDWRGVIRLAVAFLIAALSAPGLCAAGWRHAIVGKGGFSSIAVGPDGKVHYLYATRPAANTVDLFHLTISRAGHVLAKEQLMPPAGGASFNGASAIAVDSADHLQLVFPTQLGLEYGFFDGSAWSYQAIPFQCLNGDLFPNLIIDAANHPIVVCGFGPIDLLTFDGTTWTSSTVPNVNDASNATAAIANNGTIDIGYINELETITAAIGSGDTWTISSSGETGFTNFEHFGPTTALDSQNLPGIACAAEKGALVYAHFDGGMWSNETINSSVLDYSNLVFAPGDVASLVILTVGRVDLTDISFAQRTANGWTLEQIGSAPGFTAFPRIAVDRVGIPFGGLQAAMGEDAVYAFLEEPAVSIGSLQLTSASRKGTTILSGNLQLTNQGTGAGGQFKLSYFLSADAQLSGATLLGTRLESAPAVGQARAVRFKFSSPASLGGMFLIASITAVSSPSIVVNGVTSAAIPTD